MEWYLKALRQYADFEGRARRKEYWMFSLFNLIFACLIIVGTGLIGNLGIILFLLYGVGTLIPSIAVSVRRLHDVGKSG